MRFGNALLRPLGAQVSGLAAERNEDARLQQLQQRGHWSRARFANSFEWKTDFYKTFFDGVCLPFAESYSRLPLTAQAANGGYFLQNGWFESVDAEVLYSVVRHFRPKAIVEVGSGNSTKLIRRAITDGSLDTTLTSIDPDPRAAVASFCDTHVPSRVESLDPEFIASRLSAGDILFIDSSHVIRTGGDVPFLYLEVLPLLSDGVLLHAHDIFLPCDYPENMVMQEKWGWTEQYLLQALLCGGDNYEVLWPSCLMWTEQRTF
ncbi:MAG TPA: class I SAM-dependent methyltransferase, partial [Terriglobales bacterium]|nr:class I SAM-dependent methyltransferase [Terriglobales bacterium]